MTAYNTNRINDPAALPYAGSPGESPHRSPLQMIWHRRRIVVIAALIGFVGAYAYYRVATPLYTSKARIYATPAGPRLLENSMGSSALDNMYTQCKVIESTSVLADAIALLEKPEIANRLPPDSEKRLNVSTLFQSLQTNVGKTDNIIYLTYDSPDALEAQLVLDAIVQSYKEFNNRQKHSTVADSVDKLRQDKDIFQHEIDVRTEEANKYMREHELVNVDTTNRGGNPIQERLMMQEERLSAAHLETLNAQMTYEDQARASFPEAAQLQLLLETRKFNGVALSAASDERQLRDEMYSAQEELSRLKQRYLPQYPMVQAQQQKVNELDAALVIFLNQKWVSAKTREDALTREFDKTKQDVLDQAVKAAEYGRLQKSIENTTRLLETLNTRISEIHVDEDAGALNLQTLDAADLPGRPSKPNEPVLLFEGIMIGLILGVAATFLDTRLRSVEEVSAAVGLPILSVIPHMHKRQTPATRGRKVQLEPMSDVAESFRAVRSAVLFGPRAKTVLVTSAMRAEGKSTCASNLAIALAEAGHRILLVDADLRAPTQHKIFACGDAVGLSGVVAGRAPIERCIHATPIKGLELLPCGQIPFNPSETINNQVFADLLTQLAVRYDYLVIDSPPVMPVTDARILGAMCDLTILVLRAEQTGRRAAADARDGLLGFGANLLGVVVNDGPRKRSRYGYYGGYGLHRQTVPVGAKIGADRPGNGEPVTSETELLIGNTRP